MAFDWNDCCSGIRVKFSAYLFLFLSLTFGFRKASAQSFIEDKAVIRNNRIASFGLLRSGTERYVLYHQNSGNSAWNVTLFDDRHSRLESWSYITGNKGGIISADDASDPGILLFQKDFGNPALVWFDPMVPDSMQILQMDFKERLQPQRLWINGETAWIGATHKMTGYLLLRVDLKTGSIMKIPTGRSERLPLEVHDMVHDNSNNEWLVLLRFKSKRQSVYWVQKVSESGQFLEPRVRINQKEPLFSASAVKTTAGWLISGTVSLNADKTLNGFYTCSMNDQLSMLKLQITSLQNIPNFFQYLNVSDQQRIFQHADNLNKYKRSYEINTRIFTHKAIHIDDRILIAHEFYYPTFIQRTQFGPHGWNTYQEFDGFQYTHAVIFEYSENGALLRDYCLPMSFYRKPFVEQQQLFWNVNQEGIVASYMDAEVLRTAQFSGNQSMGVFRTEHPIAREDVSGRLYGGATFSSAYKGKRMIGVLFRPSRQVFGDNEQSGTLYLLKFSEK